MVQFRLRISIIYNAGKKVFIINVSGAGAGAGAGAGVVKLLWIFVGV